ncbi:MAG: DUF86 domain-containing protein [Coriobacteriales bacterium]|jgi:uncharacterized protein with HEPN domain|nr:DUF86 domain-containing protein [Coriobacteriales bacterium]
MNEYRDVLNRIVHFIEECEQESAHLNDDTNDELVLMMAYKAVALDLTQIGESVNSLRKKYPEKLAAEPSVPWDDIVGLCNVLVHNYDGIIREENRESLQINLPDLKAAIDRMRDREVS